MKYLISALLVFSFSLNLQAKIIEEVLAVVEGEMILKSELQTLKSRLKKKTLINENLLGLLKVSPTSPNKEVLDYLISKKIIQNVSLKEQGLKSKESVIQKELENLSAQNKISISKLKSEIRSRGLDFNDYKAFIGEASLIRNAIERNVISKIRPTEEDFVTYLKLNNVNNIEPSYSYNLKQIFVPKSNKGAENLIKQISSSNFETYFSSSKKLKIDALALGQLSFSDLSPSHRLVLKNLSKGDLSPVVYEQNGYRVFYIVDKSGNYNIPNTPKVRGLQKNFYDSLVEKQFSSWLKELRESYFVRINK